MKKVFLLSLFLWLTVNLSAQNVEQPVEEPEEEKLVKYNGFRLQVYTGNNTRVARQEALSAERQVRKSFPDMAVYTHFSVPHWVCRAGDFLTIDEAKDILDMMRKIPALSKARVVRCTVLLPESVVKDYLKATWKPDTTKMEIPTMPLEMDTVAGMMPPESPAFLSNP